MYKKLCLDHIIDEMKTLADMLVPYTFPLHDPVLEDDISVLKSRTVEIDGYSVVLHFNRADYGNHFVETLQIFGEKASFLPFCLVAKLGKKFLGGHHLYLVELIRDQRKIYCWTITLDKNGKPTAPRVPVKTEGCTYEGLQYQYMYPNQVNLY